MSSKAWEAAVNFVDIALKRKEKNCIEDFSPEEIQAIFEMVSAAGFRPKEVVFGKLAGNYLDQDGSRTGKTYPVNSLCPLKVVGETGDDYFATGWLDCAFRRASRNSGWHCNENREEIIEAIAKEIERSCPLEPIQLTAQGDFLQEYPPSPAYFGFEYFVKHTRDEDALGSCVGVHQYCNGWMDRHGATSTHDAIVCRKCHLRRLFPKDAKTYGDLRKSLS